MVEFLQFTLNGVVFGMIYAAIALSLVLIWRGTRVLNFAQGGMAMLTTYIAIEVIYKTHSYWAGFVIALVAGLVLGAASELTVVRPTTGKPELNAVIVTIGLLIFCLVEWLTNANYFVNNKSSLIYMGLMYVLAIAVYVIARVVRRRQGIDLGLINKEIPVE